MSACKPNLSTGIFDNVFYHRQPKSGTAWLSREIGSEDFLFSSSLIPIPLSFTETNREELFFTST